MQSGQKRGEFYNVELFSGILISYGPNVAAFAVWCTVDQHRIIFNLHMFFQAVVRSF